MEGEEECHKKKCQRPPWNSSHLTFQLISQSYAEHWLNQTSFSVVSNVLCTLSGWRVLCYLRLVQELSGNELHELRRVNCSKAQVYALVSPVLFSKTALPAPLLTLLIKPSYHISNAKVLKTTNNIFNVHLKYWLLLPALFCCFQVGS